MNNTSSKEPTKNNFEHNEFHSVIYIISLDIQSQYNQHLSSYFMIKRAQLPWTKSLYFPESIYTKAWQKVPSDTILSNNIYKLLWITVNYTFTTELKI